MLFWLPLALSGVVLGDAMGFIGLGYAAVLWALLGYMVRGSRERVAAPPEPAVR